MNDDTIRTSAQGADAKSAPDAASLVAAATNPLGGAVLTMSIDEEYACWREEHVRQLDADYQEWHQGGAKNFPADFEAWRFKRQEELLRVRSSPAGLPLMEATEDAPESEKTDLHFERS